MQGAFGITPSPSGEIAKTNIEGTDVEEIAACAGEDIEIGLQPGAVDLKIIGFLRCS